MKGPDKTCNFDHIIVSSSYSCGRAFVTIVRVEFDRKRRMVVFMTFLLEVWNDNNDKNNDNNRDNDTSNDDNNDNNAENNDNNFENDNTNQ